ncbi:uncharacterized protein LOC133920615 isoform X4 [Phragmites australis]|uniref:uncharacterized protein LOC133920615 isoform X4 n=1 Tax=Phragmites australis TaxID=29695 RepID=UPI002D7975F6|nr:uncharacterized protein LOC133920615 isoform X4 [Phragmites australis]
MHKGKANRKIVLGMMENSLQIDRRSCRAMCSCKSTSVQTLGCNLTTIEIGDECRGSVADAEEPEEGFRWLPSNRGLPPPLDPPSRPELFHMAPAGAAPSLEISKYTQRGPRLHFIPPRDPLDVPAAPTPDHLSTGTDSNSAKVPGKEERTSNCCCISSPTTT